MQVRTGQTEYTTVDGADDVDLDKDEYYLEGERLTEARAEQIAREVARRHGLKGGRPTLSPDGTTQLGLRVPLDLRTKLKARAQQQGVTESQAARDILTEALGGC